MNHLQVTKNNEHENHQRVQLGDEFACLFLTIFREFVQLPVLTNSRGSSSCKTSRKQIGWCPMDIIRSTSLFHSNARKTLTISFPNVSSPNKVSLVSLSCWSIDSLTITNELSLASSSRPRGMLEKLFVSRRKFFEKENQQTSRNLMIGDKLSLVEAGCANDRKLMTKSSNESL